MSLKVRLTTRQKTLASLCLLILALLLFVPAVQKLLIAMGGVILGRTLNHPALWALKIQRAGLYMLCVPAVVFFFSLPDKVSRALVYEVLILTAFFTSRLFSLFPFGLQMPLTDSSIFIYIGRMMHRGMVPYKDMFDHKGIVLYFIEYLGTFGKGYAGIYMIELASMFATVTFIYKAARIVSRNEAVCFLTAFIAVYVLGGKLYGGANCSEEYALPCIAFSSYVFLKYLRTGECRIRDYFFVGLTFTVVLLIRVNMVVLWAFYVPFFLIILIRDKKYSDLGTMVIGFSCGMAVILLPSMVYFFRTSSFHDMWESYIMFNFKYVSDKGGMGNILAVARMFIRIFAIPCLCLLAAFLQQRKDRCQVINSVVFLVTLFFVSISGRDYPHYGIPLLPLFALPLSYILEVLRVNLLDRADRKTACLARLCISLTVLIPVLSIPLPLRTNTVWQDSISTFLKEQTAPDSDVLVFANEAMYYVCAERYTKQRFFYQEPVIQKYRSFIGEFTDDLKSNPPDYIVLQGHRADWLRNPDFSGIRELLASSYARKDFPDGYIYVKD